MGVNDLGGSVLMGLMLNAGVESASVGRRVGGQAVWECMRGWFWDAGFCAFRRKYVDPCTNLSYDTLTKTPGIKKALFIHLTLDGIEQPPALPFLTSIRYDVCSRRKYQVPRLLISSQLQVSFQARQELFLI